MLAVWPGVWVRDVDEVWGQFWQLHPKARFPQITLALFALFPPALALGPVRRRSAGRRGRPWPEVPLPRCAAQWVPAQQYEFRGHGGHVSARQWWRFVRQPPALCTVPTSTPSRRAWPGRWQRGSLARERGKTIGGCGVLSDDNIGKHSTGRGAGGAGQRATRPRSSRRARSEQRLGLVRSGAHPRHSARPLGHWLSAAPVKSRVEPWLRRRVARGPDRHTPGHDQHACQQRPLQRLLSYSVGDIYLDSQPAIEVILFCWHDI